MGEERSFKKSALGGFNRKDVIEYIEQLMTQLEEERAESRRKDERIYDLERKLEQYEEACSAAAAECPDESGETDDVLAQIDAILLKYLGKEE
ncbi:MAG: DivIVA domain-containing protein [Clostridia bacterium]|nr:DivIVA domain-containing protein [Clostridia bacterium]